MTIPDGVVSIDAGAFEYCMALERVTIGNRVETIGYKAFYSCDSLTDVCYAGSRQQWDEIDIGEDNDPLLNAEIHYNYIPVRPQGDVDGDGAVTNSDLVTIARYLVGLTEGDVKKAVEAYADMNGDGRVDNEDVVTAARIVVGL